MSEQTGAANLFDGLSKFCALILLIAYIITAINANWTFITDETVLKVISYIMYYGPLTVVALVGLEFAQGKSFLTQLIIYIVIAAAVIINFLPGTWNSIISMIPGQPASA